MEPVKPIECTVMCMQCMKTARTREVRCLRSWTTDVYRWLLVECHGTRRLVEFCVRGDEGTHHKRFWDDLKDVFPDPKAQAEGLQGPCPTCGKGSKPIPTVKPKTPPDDREFTAAF